MALCNAWAKIQSIPSCSIILSYSPYYLLRQLIRYTLRLVNVSNYFVMPQLVNISSDRQPMMLPPSLSLSSLCYWLTSAVTSLCYSWSTFCPIDNLPMMLVTIPPSLSLSSLCHTLANISRHRITLQLVNIDISSVQVLLQYSTVTNGIYGRHVYFAYGM